MVWFVEYRRAAAIHAAFSREIVFVADPVCLFFSKQLVLVGLDLLSACSLCVFDCLETNTPR